MTVFSYNDTEIGDKVLLVGTVIDVNESGVQLVELPEDSGYFVITHKLSDKLKEAIEDELGTGCFTGDSCDL